MKRLFANLLSLAVFFILCLFTLNVNAQVMVDPIAPNQEYNNDIDSMVAYAYAEESAHFPGGDKELSDFLVENIKFPNDPADVQGKVYLSFIVEKDGSLTNIKVLRGLYRPIDEEAIRVVKLMPKWIPGKHNGKIVRQKYTLPIKFELR